MKQSPPDTLSGRETGRRGKKSENVDKASGVVKYLQMSDDMF